MIKYPLIFLTLVAWNIADAGLVIKKNVKSQNLAGESTLKIDTNFYRTDTYQSGELQSSVIYDKSKDVIYFFIKHPQKGKVFYEASRDAIAEAKKNPQYKAAAQKAKEGMNKGLSRSADVTKMMKNMNPAQKKMFEKMMKNKGPQAQKMPKNTRDLSRMPANEYKKSSGSKKIAGYACNNWDVFVMNNKSAKVCGAPKFSAIDKYMPLFNSAQKLSKEWGTFIGESFGLNNPSAHMNMIFDVQRKVGFPLETTQLNPMTGSVQSVETVQSVNEQALSASDFKHPEGFKKIHFFDLFASR